MGILSGLLGNAGETDGDKTEQELAELLIADEHVHKAYKLVRDLFVFTNKRLLLIDKQGLTGKKIEYLSIPYRAITRFAIESSGHFDLDSELRIWVSGNHEPLSYQFSKGANIVEVQRALAEAVLG